MPGASTTGRLYRSLVVKPFKKAVTIFSSRPYARIQQEGGVVKSKRPNGMLAIPLRLKERRSHTWPKMWSKGALELAINPDPSHHGAYLRIKVGNKRRGEKGELVYRLVKQVTIPGRPYIVKSKELVTYMRTLLAAKLKRLERGG
jgi:hypothetical protein